MRGLCQINNIIIMLSSPIVRIMCNSPQTSFGKKTRRLHQWWFNSQRDIRGRRDALLAFGILLVRCLMDIIVHLEIHHIRSDQNVMMGRITHLEGAQRGQSIEGSTLVSN
jgi:hypothetical protein